MDAGLGAALAGGFTAAATFGAVVWQGRKTRHRGTEEHMMARDMLMEHGRKLDRIDGKVDRLDEKVDRIDGRVDVLEVSDAKLRAVPPIGEGA